MNIDRATAAQTFLKRRKLQSGPPVRSSDVVRRYPIECPTCGMVLHQSHADIYGECVLCGAKVKPNDKLTRDAGAKTL